jgi:hypothetical protein
MVVKTISWRPVLVSDHREFIREHPEVDVVDTVATQTLELYAATRPDLSFEMFAEKLIRTTAWYSVPWRGALVRLLRRDYFAQLINARSRVLEPLAHGPELRELRLADMDMVTSTSLGRLPAGIADLGTPKVVRGARLVTEVRPWANVTLFEDGLAPDNLGDFLDGLDIVVCAMDDPVMKLRLRRMAAARRVDVVMGTDVEQGIIDFEPYATHPNHQPFNGLVSEPTLKVLDNPGDITPQRTIAAIAEIVGLQNLTLPALHMAAALMRGQLASMSQLATTATIVGGAVARLIHLRLCGHPVQTGRIVLGIESALTRDLDDTQRTTLLAALAAGLQPAGGTA